MRRPRRVPERSGPQISLARAERPAPLHSWKNDLRAGVCEGTISALVAASAVCRRARGREPTSPRATTTRPTSTGPFDCPLERTALGDPRGLPRPTSPTSISPVLHAATAPAGSMPRVETLLRYAAWPKAKAARSSAWESS
jgi:hypothetical protein